MGRVPAHVQADVVYRALSRARVCGSFLVAVVCLLFGLGFAPAVFIRPSTSDHGFTSDAVATINDRGDIDCGVSSLSVVLRGPRVAVPSGDLARRAEEVCRHAAVDYVWCSGIGLVLVTVAGITLVARARRIKRGVCRRVG